MGKNLRYRKSSKPTKRLTSGAKDRSTGPTPGLNNAHFSQDSLKDAAMFAKVRNKLSRYMGTQIWRHVSVAAMTMVELETPVFVVQVQLEQSFRLENTGKSV